MSRIGRQPIEVPKGVSVSVADGFIKVKGPKGELGRKVVPQVSISQQDNLVTVDRDNDQKDSRAYHGLMRALLANMVTGVSKGFERKLEIHGVGYKADIKGNKLVLNLGYSHPIDFPFPDGIKIAVETGRGPMRIVVTGVDKEQVGQTAAEIRGFRSPDSYKGKGIRYEGEYVRLKAGKSGQ